MQSDTGFQIFDLHQHIGSFDAGGGDGTHSYTHDDDFRARSAAMDRFGLRAAVAMPSLQYARPRGFADTQALNDGIARYRDRHRERFPVALGTVQPLDPAEMSVGEIARMSGELKLDGVVWHHRFQSAWISDRRMHPLLDACAKHQMVVFIHVISDSNMESPVMMEELYEAHPDVKFVALDPLTGFTQNRYVMHLAKRCPNLLFDTALNLGAGRSIEEFVHKNGSERLLFGTDLYLAPDPLYVYPHVLREVLDAPTLSDDDRRNIFWNNAARLFPRALSVSA